MDGLKGIFFFLSKSKSDWEQPLYPWGLHGPRVLYLDVLGHLLGLLPTPAVLGSLSEDEFRDLFGGGEPQGRFAADLLVEEDTQLRHV